MTGIHHLDPITYMQVTRPVDDGRGRPVRQPGRVRSFVRRLPGRGRAERPAGRVAAAPAGAAR